MIPFVFNRLVTLRIRKICLHLSRCKYFPHLLNWSTSLICQKIFHTWMITNYSQHSNDYILWGRICMWKKCKQTIRNLILLSRILQTTTDLIKTCWDNAQMCEWKGIKNPFRRPLLTIVLKLKIDVCLSSMRLERQQIVAQSVNPISFETVKFRTVIGAPKFFL